MTSNLSIGLSILQKNMKQSSTVDEEDITDKITTLSDYLEKENICNKELNNVFNVWFHDANESNFNLESFHNINNFNNIKDFLIINQLLKNNYKMLLNGMFFVMKNNIKPIWHDNANKNGGCISWKIEKYNSIKYWENLLLLFITDNLPKELNNYGINGISINPKKNCNIIKVWLATDINGDILNKIDLTDKCLFRDKLKLYKSFKKFI